MQAHLELALGSVLDKGCILEWQAVRRRLNKQFDELATRGVFWAADLRSAGKRIWLAPGSLSLFTEGNFSLGLSISLD